MRSFRRLLIAGLLLVAILATVSGARATTQRQACVSYTITLYGWSVTTPPACRPCIPLPAATNRGVKNLWDTTTCPAPTSQ